MRWLLSALLIVVLGVSVGCPEKIDPEAGERLRRSVAEDRKRVQANFELVRLLDAQQYAEAQTRFAAMRVPNSMGDDITSNLFARRAWNEARDGINGNINGWIIQEAGHAQYPPLGGLLNVPMRLQFLQELAVYRERSPAKTESGRRSDALVAEILARAVKRGAETRPLGLRSEEWGYDLSHASRLLPLNGLRAAEIKKRFGDNPTVLTKDFERPVYGGVMVPTEADTQLMYAREMGHILVYLSRGRVLLAVEEWSDY